MPQHALRLKCAWHLSTSVSWPACGALEAASCLLAMSSECESAAIRCCPRLSAGWSGVRRGSTRFARAGNRLKNGSSRSWARTSGPVDTRMSAILIVAHLTLYDARRRRIVTAALLCAAAFLAVFGVAVFFAHAEMMQDTRLSFIARQANVMLLTLAGMFAANFLSVLFAVLLPVDALSGEIDSGVMQTLACKPIRRADIVLGKWLGHAVLVTAYVLSLTGGVLVSVRAVTGFSPTHVERAIPLMLLETMLLMTVSVAGGTRLSTITNGVMALGFYGV